MDFVGKEVQSNKKGKEENREGEELEKKPTVNGDQLIKILSPVKCPVTMVEKPEKEEEEECTTPKAEQFKIPQPLECPRAPKPKRRRGGDHSSMVAPTISFQTL
ncbi:hypothetical protein ISN44_As06g023600 [Arabidopsis suecica]|uniref:Uncharacterized protein n=1 Tax=Arabidopsis suecica TaxID=45249 RepID=A0A8T2CIL8_ARASU|nr:hypothetical protein ISN44_As06g023600 [Arabidopsis suecica]